MVAFRSCGSLDTSTKDIYLYTRCCNNSDKVNSVVTQPFSEYLLELGRSLARAKLVVELLAPRAHQKQKVKEQDSSVIAYRNVALRFCHKRSRTVIKLEQGAPS